MPVMSAVSSDHPLMKAWIAYQATDEYNNTAKWASTHTSGSLWAAFMKGWNLATARAVDMHSNINPANDTERLNGDPGAGAMGAVIEYRDAIRADT